MNNIKKYYFSEIVAKDVGVEEAIMLSNIYFWIQLNTKKEHNFHEGKYWMFNSVREFSEQFSFWSDGQIRRILSNLELKDYISTGAFNRKGYDKTKWYTTTEKALLTLGNDKTFAETVKALEENREPIPDSIHK